MDWILILAHLTMIEIAPLAGTQISITKYSNNIMMDQSAQATIRKASRRSYMISCCGSQSCRGPDYAAKKLIEKTTTSRNPLAVFQYQRTRRGRPVAVAEFSEDGFTISCPNCPLNWQEILSFIPAPPGAIPLICPLCPTEWRDLLQIKPQTTERRKKTTKPSKSDDADEEETDSTDTDSTDETEKPVSATKPATTTTTSTVKITTLAPTTVSTTSTVTNTTVAATTAGGGGGLGGILSGGLGGLLGGVLGGGGNKPKGTKPPTTQPSFQEYGFKLD